MAEDVRSRDTIVVSPLLDDDHLGGDLSESQTSPPRVRFTSGDLSHHSEEEGHDDERSPERRGSHGLGISTQDSNAPYSSSMSIHRVPVGSKGSSPATPNASKVLLSSPRFQTTSPYVSTEAAALQHGIPAPSPIDNEDKAHRKRRWKAWVSPKWRRNGIFQSPGSDGDLGGTPTGRDRGLLSPDLEYHDVDDESEFCRRYSRPPHYCDSKDDIQKPRQSWLSITILALAVYSAVMSSIWLVLSFIEPRWGHGISSNGALTPSTASFLVALFSKTIEMSFVTVYVLFLGQAFTRRAFSRKSKGMTLAEMTVRDWVIQPGSLITHWPSMKHAAPTTLGIVSIIAVLGATLFTTASEAMISPKLMYGEWHPKQLQGTVLAKYANPMFVRDSCATPLRGIDVSIDEAGAACLNAQYSGESYRNLVEFMKTWEAIKTNGTSTIVDLAERPAGTTSIYSNTTLMSAWIDNEYGNVTESFETHGRIINNVTLAIPHPGVYAAARDPINNILQPSDLSEIGEYSIRASVISPAVNVLCVNVDEDELAPLVYTAWPTANTTESSSVPGQILANAEWEEDIPLPGDWNNKTVLDDVFLWGEERGRMPPIFEMYPMDYNMVVGKTSFELKALYILLKPVGFSFSPSNYTLCQLQSWVTPKCSTHFNISGTDGAHMHAHCEDPNDPNRYVSSVPDVPHLPADVDWPNIAEQWRLSMDINGGANNNNASNARILTQLALQEPSLQSLLPSLSEALAVYVSSTLVTSSLKSTFRHWWPYEATTLGEPGIGEVFNASIRTQSYASAHTARWQAVFYLVLISVVLISWFCVAYFLYVPGLVTDFTEPPNLFALAVNSPPSHQIKGSCGGGPEGKAMAVPWRVGYSSGANHYFFEEAVDGTGYDKVGASDEERGKRQLKGQSYKRLSSARGWI